MKQHRSMSGWVVRTFVLTLLVPFGLERAACQASAEPYGYGEITLGVRARTAFGIRSERVSETARTGVDSAVKARAQIYAQHLDFDETCSRFFVDADVVVVMLAAACDLPKMRVADYGTAVMAVSRDGRTVAGPVFEPAGWVLKILPAYRRSADLPNARRSERRTLEQPSDSGYLIPGPQAAAAFGVPALDRVPEKRLGIPTDLVDVAARLAEERHKRPACNRFFESGDVYIVLLTSFCGEHIGKETDALVLIGLRRDGTVIAEISWMTSVGGADVQPFGRF